MASFFISYTGSDEEWARWVDRVLRDSGHHTIVQFADFGIGSNFAAEMDKALRACNRVILLLSEASLNSVWVREEWTNALDTVQRKVLPVKVRACKPDGLLAKRVFFDLTSVTDEAEAARQLLRQVEGLGGREQPAPFPNQAKDDGKDKPNPAWPQYPPRGVFLDREVVGRDEDVAQLRQTLLDQQAAAILPATVVKGQGGMGKSTLAKYYVRTYRQHYRGIWWLKAQSRTEVIQGLCDLARMLIDTTPIEDSENLAQQGVSELQRTDGPWLIVFDNAETLGGLRDLLPDRHDIHLLLTSREGGWPDRFEVHPTDKLPPDMAADLLEQESGRADDRAGALMLGKVLDGLPLALVQAGRWLRDVPGTSFAGYAEQHETLLHQMPSTIEDYPDSVFGAVKLSLDKLSEDAAMLMKVFAYLAPDDLWLGLVTALAAKNRGDEMYVPVPAALLTLAGEGPAVERAFSDLGRRSLMEPGEHAGSWRMHRLAQAVQRGLLSDQGEGDSRFRANDESEDWPAISAAVLAAGYPYDSDLAENFPTCVRLNPHVAALDGLGAAAPATRAMDYLYNQAGTYYSTMRQDRISLRYAIANIRTKQRRGVAPRDAMMDTGWSNLAARLSNLGRPVWAERASARAVQIAGEDLAANPGVSDANRAIGLSVHGGFLYRLAVHRRGDAILFDRARVRFHQALRLKRVEHGQRSREVAVDLNNLAALHSVRGRGGTAAVLCRTALSIRRRVLPPGDADLGEGCNNLGALLLERGNLAEAQPLLEEALAIFEVAFAANPSHPHTLSTARVLGAAHLLAGDRAAAEGLVDRLPVEMAELEALAAKIKAGWSEGSR
ncbi:MAG: TIR domain-containing protein [Pseudomonadota bacterium]